MHQRSVPMAGDPEHQRLLARSVQFTALFAAAPMGIALLTPAQRYAEANPALCRLLGPTEAELRALPYAAMCHPLDLLAELEAVAHLLAEPGGTMRFRRRYCARDGRVIPTEVTGVVWRDAAGEVAGTLRWIRDLGETEADAERERLATALLHARRDLAQYAAVLSHDVQEPLRLVAICLDLLAAPEAAGAGSPAQASLALAREGAARLRRLLRDLASFARLSAARPARAPAAFAILVERACTALASEIAASGCQVQVDGLPTLAVDAEAMAGVFRHLLANAIACAGGRPPRVRISAQADAGGWCFSVADAGIGVPEGDRGRVFDLLRRVPRAGDGGGSGMGLALCRAAIEAHGGRIWIEETVGPGTVVRFTCPDAPA